MVAGQLRQAVAAKVSMYLPPAQSVHHGAPVTDWLASTGENLPGAQSRHARAPMPPVILSFLPYLPLGHGLQLIMAAVLSPNLSPDVPVGQSV